MLGRAVGALKVSSRKVTPTPSVPPTSSSVAGVQGFPLTISANRAKPHRDDLAVLGKPGNRLIQERLLVAAEIADLFGQGPVGLPECRQHFPGMARIEEIDESAVLILRAIGFPGPA